VVAGNRHGWLRGFSKMWGPMMGGYGSGRRDSWSKKTTVEECLVLNVRDLRLDRRAGLEATFTAEVGGTSTRLRAVSSPCRFGGVRWWIVCSCGRRVLKVYRPPGGLRFACRTCHGLTYTSAQEAHKFEGLFKRLAERMEAGVTASQVRAYFAHEAKGWKGKT
jgi:hypothetical protein